MARLRAPDGCPWDQEQTHQSIARCLVEEAAEVLEAIDTENVELLREELGDLLLQVVFHAQIEEEAGKVRSGGCGEGDIREINSQASPCVWRSQ